MKTIAKWLTQIFVGSFLFWLGMLTSAFLPIGGPSMGDYAERICVFVPLACTVGVVFGDKIFYKDRKISILAVITAPIFGVMGIYLSFFLREAAPSYPTSYITSIIVFTFSISVVAIPVVIAYNTVSYLSRKKFTAYKKLIAELFVSICLTFESMFIMILLSGSNDPGLFVKIICASLGATIAIALTDKCIG